MLQDLIRDLEKLASPQKALNAARFFKTGKGEYGEGDVFIGITVPEQRKVAKKYKDLPLKDIQKLLRSKIHEHRFTALEILVMKMDSCPVCTGRLRSNDRNGIVDFYLKNLKYVNNWDLVDTSAPYILGKYLVENPSTKLRVNILYDLAKSKNIWERRVAIVSTQALIRKNIFNETLKIAEELLRDKEDLIHKACGWMLREVGKKDGKVLRRFLDKNVAVMPRTMLRYSIEKFAKIERHKYLHKK